MLTPIHAASNGNRHGPALPRPNLRHALLPALILGALVRPAHAAGEAAAPANAAARAVSFHEGLLNMGVGPQVDISRFEKPNAVLPGRYASNILLNGEWRARIELRIADEPDHQGTQPCFERDMLARIGIALAKVDAVEPAAGQRQAMPATSEFCGPLGDYIPGASAAFDGSDQTLTLSVPQIYLSHDAGGYVDPKYWDAGINAGVVNYNASLYRNRAGPGGARLSGYVGINASANLGSWHLSHLSSFNWTERGRTSYETAANYLQHDVPSLMSQLYVGDLYTSGTLFNSVNLRGAALLADDRMLPESLRGYAPSVRGIAETQARVVIRQRGYVLLDTTVAPGPFVIDDLYPTGYGGDLEVEIHEADGRIKRISVPYAAVPQLLRAGQSRWELAAGKVRQPGRSRTPVLATATYQRGITDQLTAYGGTTLATGYRAALIGGALNTGLGAFSLDATHTHARIAGLPPTEGSSVRLGYSRNLPELGTSFSLAAYRYSTRGYVDVADLVDLRDASSRGGAPAGASLRSRARSQLTVSINQRLGNRGGQLFLNGVRRDYWSRDGRQLDFTVGYSNQWRSLSYSLSAQRTRETIQGLRPSDAALNTIPGLGLSGARPGSRLTRSDTRVFLSVSVPLGHSSAAPNLSALVERSNLAGRSGQLALNGLAGAEQQLSYNAALARQGGSNAFNLSGQYNGGHGNVRAGYGRGDGYTQASLGLSGGLVLHGGGPTWSPPLGETIGLVHVPGGRGAHVDGGQRSVVDANGFAVVPSLIAYQSNRVAIDPRGMSMDTELQMASQQTAPRARAVVLLDYKTTGGRPLLIDGMLESGEPLPFGAEVSDEQGAVVGVTGQGGQVLVRGVERAATLTVRWGEGAGDRCLLRIDPASTRKHDGELEHMQRSCEAPRPPH
ncbi:fimbria/pilus outer membrane usher protein [Dyella sp. 2RAB6]|uniref:fimbria/pilus outer membrane usher protein n=1 Tax=Dyella sp. 2RAB6 TaxID=3232992 RepID=UPI003F9361A1